MKAIAFLPAAAAAVLALNISVASSQDVCVKEYQACMDSCGSRPSKSMQDSCFTSCESKNDMCSERVFGKRQYTPAAANAQAPAAAPAKDAMAQKEQPLAREEQAAPEQELAAEAKPAPAEPKKAPPQRVPVRR
jgi:hypothetical protein